MLFFGERSGHVFFSFLFFIRLIRFVMFRSSLSAPSFVLHSLIITLIIPSFAVVPIAEAFPSVVLCFWL